MYLYEVFSHADRFRYRAHIISSATCAFILCAALTLLPPFLLTFYTGDFWIQESFYSEQPRLANKTKYILLASNNNPNNSDNRFFMSSYATLNQNFQDFVIPGSVIQSASDVDGDGLIDQYRISFDLIFTNTMTALSSINVWLIFPYELRGRQRITMETMALINIVPPSALTPSSNKNVTVYGQLTFQQKMAIQNSGNDSTYNRSIIPTDNSLSTPASLDSILDEYFTRKYYTSYQNQYTWLTPRTTTTDTNRITISVVLNSGRQSIRFRPGFWQAFKWGWIQYISVLLPFLAVFNRMKLFVFSNQLVRTLVPFPIHRHKA